jgi:hypothetical protein
MTDNTYPTDVEGWAHRRLREAGDINVGGPGRNFITGQSYLTQPRDLLSPYRTLEPVHPQCPSCGQSFEYPKFERPLHQHRGIAFTVTCACGTTATGVFWR